MRNFSNIISKNVICKQSGQLVGFVFDVCICPKTKKVLGWIVCDEESQEDFFVEWKNVENIKDFVVVKDFSICEKNQILKTCNPLGKKIISSSGLFLGEVLDFEIERKRIVKVVTKFGEIWSKNLHKFDNNIIFFSTKRMRKKKRKHSFQPREIQQKVEILIQDFSIQKEDLQEKNTKIESPLKSNIIDKNSSIIGKTNHLIRGKQISFDIFGNGNELIAKSGDIVSEKIIQKAKKHNKYNLLVHSCK